MFYTFNRSAKTKKKPEKSEQNSVGAVSVAGPNSPEVAEILQVDRFERTVKIFSQGSIVEVNVEVLEYEEGRLQPFTCYFIVIFVRPHFRKPRRATKCSLVKII